MVMIIYRNYVLVIGMNDNGQLGQYYCSCYIMIRTSIGPMNEFIVFGFEIR